MQGGSWIPGSRPQLCCSWVLSSTSFSQRQWLNRILLVDYSCTRHFSSVHVTSAWQLWEISSLIFWDSLDGRREVEQERQGGAEKLRVTGLWSVGPLRQETALAQTCQTCWLHGQIKEMLHSHTLGFARHSRVGEMQRVCISFLRR